MQVVNYYRHVSHGLHKKRLCYSLVSPSMIIIVYFTIKTILPLHQILNEMHVLLLM